MNTHVQEFFQRHYAPGRIGLIGSTEPLYRLIREGQRNMTVDGSPSMFNHAFLMGRQRPDGRDDGSIYVFESDIQLSITDWELRNGVMESRLAKLCRDDLDHAAVLGLDLTEEEVERLLQHALRLAYDENRLRYPVVGLLGTLVASLTDRLKQKNIFDNDHAVQCATFVRVCYQHIGRDFIARGSHLTNTSPEEIWRSQLFTARYLWNRHEP
jgi:hypothetical protein